MSLKASYPDIGVEMNFLTGAPVCLAAPMSGARYVTFSEDVTIIPVEGQKGVHTFFPADEAISLNDFGDCIIVAGNVPEGYVPAPEEVKAIEGSLEDKEVQRLALLKEAQDLNLEPHPNTGIVKLTAMIEKFKTEKAEAEAAAALNGQGDADKPADDSKPADEGSNPPSGE